MMLFFKGVIKKAVLQDLNDIKSAVEQPWSLAAWQRQAADGASVPCSRLCV